MSLANNFHHVYICIYLKFLLENLHFVLKSVSNPAFLIKNIINEIYRLYPQGTFRNLRFMFKTFGRSLVALYLNLRGKLNVCF